VPPQGGRKHPHQEFIQIDTSNILFICGGAFDGIEKVVEKRTGNQGIGLVPRFVPRRMSAAATCCRRSSTMMCSSSV